MGDVRQRARNERGELGNFARALGRGVAHERADFQLPILAHDAVEAVDGVDVDEQLRRRQAHIERGDKALAAGQQPGAVAMLGEQGDRLFKRARFPIGKRCGFHRSSPWRFFYCERERRDVNAAAFRTRPGYFLHPFWE